MIKAIARWFIKDEIDSLNNSIAILEETEQRLEAKIVDHDALELRLRIAEMYANDDDALIELVGLYEIKKKDSDTLSLTGGSFAVRSGDYSQAAAMQAQGLAQRQLQRTGFAGQAQGGLHQLFGGGYH